MRLTFWLMLALTLAFGCLLGWVDTRPGWDDTGITVMALFIASALAGILMPRFAWLWALTLGGPLAAFDHIVIGNSGGLAGLLVALVGSYGGALIGKYVRQRPS